ncbi:hypothetical protein, partial [Bradyrhizobium elkanii]|uniref:hypothetical protein n=1 Tax=Bradyrhizobium elkanii TaxID=29448 RepID=UPI001AEDBEDC
KRTDGCKNKACRPHGILLDDDCPAGQRSRGALVANGGAPATNPGLQQAWRRVGTVVLPLTAKQVFKAERNLFRSSAGRSG